VTPAEATLALLADDEQQPRNELRQSELWQRVLKGDMARPGLRTFAGLWWTTLAGTAAFATSSLVANVDQEDGRAIFREILRSLESEDKDPERLWRCFAEELGCCSDELDAALDKPLLGVAEFLHSLRRFGHDSAHEAAGVAHMLDSQLPRLYDDAAGALQRHYGQPREALAYFLLEASRGEARRRFATHLVQRYCDSPRKGYEARRAAREVAFAWRTMCDEMLDQIERAA